MVARMSQDELYMCIHRQPLFVFQSMSLRVDKARRLSISPGRLLHATAVHERLIARLGNPEWTLM